MRQSNGCGAMGDVETPRASHPAAPPKLPAQTRALLELPQTRKRPQAEVAEQPPRKSTRFGRTFDALKLINSVAFALHLRKVDDFPEAMLDAKRVDHPDGDEATRDASGDPGTTTLFRAARRMDILGMNLERRIWHQEVLEDSVDAINVYSDSSPVTGTEIQGMLCDVVKTNGAVRRVALPGGTLSYGNFDAIAKTMVFLWSSWLVFGPTLEHMLYFVNHITCWTTDFGIEVHGIEIPDCLQAFLAWVAGHALENVRPLINFSRRLFW